MKNRRFMKYALGLSLVFLLSSTALAKEVLLSETEFLYKGNKSTAELWGDRVKSGYANELTLVLKREDGSVITGYKPNIKGGYGFDLRKVQVVKKDNPTEQLLLSVKQGDWNSYSEYRILDPSNSKAIKELFDGGDSFGIVLGAELEGDTLKVKTIKDSKPINVELKPKLLEDVAANRKQVSFGKLQSLTCIDIDEDGVDELATNQVLTVDKKLVADVGAVWRYTGPKQADKVEPEADKANAKEEAVEAKKEKKKNTSFEDIIKLIKDELSEKQEEATGEADKALAKDKAQEKKWQHSNLTIMKCETVNKKNTINDGAFFSGGMVYPVKMVASNGEATYPQIMLNNNLEAEQKLNKLLWEEAEPFVRGYLQGKVDLAYNVIRADKKLLTIQLISGKDIFAHHNINILPGEYRRVELSDFLDVKSKGLLELLQVLNNNQNITWDKKLTKEWYMRNDNLYLMKNVKGTDEVSGYDMNNLKKYIKDPHFLPGKEEKKEAKKG